MAYEPINWQTGDIITAERLNRMDRGWDVETTELFSETVTTAEQGGIYGAALAYSETIDADTLTVTFDGTEYVCSRIDKFGNHFYGGFGEQGPVFTEYPFYLVSNRNGNTVSTETASTHTVAASVASLQTSADFNFAVSSVFGTSSIPFRCVSGQTTYSAMIHAQGAGRLMYFQFAKKTYFIHRILDTTETTVVEFFPENTSVEINFVNDVFTVTELQ